MWRGLASAIAAIVLGVGAVCAPVVAFGATLVFVPPTGMPDPLGEAVKNAQTYYLHNTACREPGKCDEVRIDYPASFWPLVFLPRWCADDCQKWDVSVQDGVEQLTFAMGRALAGTDDKVVLFGHSQGAAVISDTMRSLSDTLTDEEKARLEVVLTGNIDNPAGGLWSRLGFLGHVPILDVTTGLPTPTDTGIKFTSIIMQYDGVGNSPKYWGNPLAVANAIAGFVYLHGTTLSPDMYSPREPCAIANCRVPDYYPTVEEYMAAVRDPANAKTDQFGNTYITVPTATLPIVMPFLDLAARTHTSAFVKPLVDLVSPVLRVLIDLGYDPNEDPGVYAPLSILPFSLATNPITVLDDLGKAVVQGIHDAINGGTTPPTDLSGAIHPVSAQDTPSADSTLLGNDDSEMLTAAEEPTSTTPPAVGPDVSPVGVTDGPTAEVLNEPAPTDDEVAGGDSDVHPPVTAVEDDQQAESTDLSPDSSAESDSDDGADKETFDSSADTVDDAGEGVDNTAESAADVNEDSASQEDTADESGADERDRQSHENTETANAAAA
jgi:PE-PPE domain